jgi:CheY-like chemotaxis protein
VQRDRILCVDDEPALLDFFHDCLVDDFEVERTSDAREALRLIDEGKSFSAVLTDVRMPEMDGITLLDQVRSRCPNTVRMLITGNADVDVATRAVNQGQVFRFLMKPIDPEELARSCRAAADHYRIVCAERDLLENTVHRVVKMLTDLLALASPLAFGHATRVRQLASLMTNQLHVTDLWQIEVAAMLSQIGAMTLPAETMEKMHAKIPLTREEEEMTKRAQRVTTQLLESIPRFEPILAILQTLNGESTSTAPDVLQAARILRVAIGYDLLETQGVRSVLALDLLYSEPKTYDKDIIKVLEDVRNRPHEGELCRLPAHKLLPGMRLAENLLTVSGALLLARGQELTSSMVERLKNFRREGIKEPVSVIV